MPNTPSTRSALLFDGHDPPVEVAATVIRDMPWARLEEIESIWKPSREQFGQAFFHQTGRVSEHGHWDWRNKVRLEESGRYRLVAIECRGEVQGLMTVSAQPRPAAAINADKAPLLYVDFLENAPWNLKGTATPRRFRGVGVALITEAVEISKDAGWSGRIGLHSLPQAEWFYKKECKMTPIDNPDSSYPELVYYEYTVE